VNVPEPAEPVSAQDIKAAVGSMLFLWSDLERALRDALRTELFADRPEPVHQISRVLDLWSGRVGAAGPDRPLQREVCGRLRDLLGQALRVRNMICHGLVGYSAEDRGRSREAHLVVELGGERRDLGWGELQAMFAWMSRSRWVIEDLTRAALEADATAGEAFLRGWEGFPQKR